MLKNFKLDKLFMKISIIIPILLSLIFLISNNLLIGIILVLSIIYIIRKYQFKHFSLYLILLAIIVRGVELSKNHTKSCGCLRSGGEYNIIQWLEKNNIEYESQKKFPNLVGINGGNLSYDFYLPTYNLLIEAQGQQHITPKELFGGEEQFQKQQEHDKRKRDYAEANGYKLLEIWYYDYDRIEEILNRELEVV